MGERSDGMDIVVVVRKVVIETLTNGNKWSGGEGERDFKHGVRAMELEAPDGNRVEQGIER